MARAKGGARRWRLRSRPSTRSVARQTGAPPAAKVSAEVSAAWIGRAQFDLGLTGQLRPFARQIGLFRVGLRTDRYIFAGRHRHRTRDQSCDPRHKHVVCCRRGGGDAHDRAGSRNDAVIGAQYGRAQPTDARDAVGLGVKGDRAHHCAFRSGKRVFDS